MGRGHAEDERRRDRCWCTPDYGYGRSRGSDGHDDREQQPDLRGGAARARDDSERVRRARFREEWLYTRNAASRSLRSYLFYSSSYVQSTVLATNAPFIKSSARPPIFRSGSPPPRNTTRRGRRRSATPASESPRRRKRRHRPGVPRQPRRVLRLRQAHVELALADLPRVVQRGVVHGVQVLLQLLLGQASRVYCRRRTRIGS